MSVVRILGNGYYGVEASGVSIKRKAFERIRKLFDAAISEDMRISSSSTTARRAASSARVFKKVESSARG
jgi:hypothetical protein